MSKNREEKGEESQGQGEPEERRVKPAAEACFCGREGTSVSSLREKSTLWIFEFSSASFFFFFSPGVPTRETQEVDQSRASV